MSGKILRSLEDMEDIATLERAVDLLKGYQKTKAKDVGPVRYLKDDEVHVRKAPEPRSPNRTSHVINKRNGRFKVWSLGYLNRGERGMSPAK